MNGRKEKKMSTNSCEVYNNNNDLIRKILSDKVDYFDYCICNGWACILWIPIILPISGYHIPSVGKQNARALTLMQSSGIRLEVYAWMWLGRCHRVQLYEFLRGSEWVVWTTFTKCKTVQVSWSDAASWPTIHPIINSSFKVHHNYYT